MCSDFEMCQDINVTYTEDELEKLNASKKLFSKLDKSFFYYYHFAIGCS